MDGDKFTPGTIVDREDFSDDLWTIRIRPRAPIAFRAGQYVTVGVEQEGRLLERPYSIVSSPAEPELELFVELVPDGLLTPHLHPLGVGADVVLRTRCKGVFLKECPVDTETHLFVATVTGIAPFCSLIRSLVARQGAGEWAADSRIVVLQGASRSLEFVYDAELRGLAAEHDWLTYVPTVSRPWEDPGWTGETGRVEDVLRKHGDALGIDPGRAGIYLCGHPGMIAGARAIMLRRGFDDRAIREEQYWPEGK